jgi:hypothetical protein
MAGSVNHAVEPLVCKCETLSSNLSPTKMKNPARRDSAPGFDSQHRKSTQQTAVLFEWNGPSLRLSVPNPLSLARATPGDTWPGSLCPTAPDPSRSSYRTGLVALATPTDAQVPSVGTS